MKPILGASIRPYGLATILVALAGCAASGAPLTANNIVVSQIQVAAPQTALNGQAGTASLREFGLSGALGGTFNGNTIAFNSAATDTQRLVWGGTTTSEGALTLSNNGQYLTIAGYNFTAGQVSPNGTTIGSSFNNGSTTDVRRTVGRIDAGGVVNYFDMTNSYSQSNVRSVTSLDGSTFITGGVSGTTAAHAGTGGVRSFNPAAGNTTTSVLTPTPVNIRNVNHDLSGTVFFSTQSAGFIGINVLSGGQGYLLAGFSAVTGLNPSDFWFRDENTLYVADTGALTSTTTTVQGGLQKWTKDASGTWTLNYRITSGLTAGLLGLAGTVDASGAVILYATTNDTVSASAGNRLVGVIDSGAASSFTTLATASGNSAFRGVDFTPGTVLVPAPATGAMLCVSGLLLARRRREIAA